MKTITTKLGFEYDVEVKAVSCEGIDIEVTCEEGSEYMIGFPIAKLHVSDVQLYLLGHYDAEELIEDDHITEIEKWVDDKSLSAININELTAVL